MTDKITIDRETLERAVDILDRRLNWNPVVDKLCSEINAALAAQPVSNQLSGNPGQLAAQPAEPTDAEAVCAEAYQVVGRLLDDLGQFDTERGGKILDNLNEARLVHKDVLPWRSFAQPAPAAVPPGYVLVPVEPTYEINKAIRMAVRAGCFDDGIYRAMIAAAGDKP